jgi:hypothetical protein
MIRIIQKPSFFLSLVGIAISIGIGYYAANVMVVPAHSGSGLRFLCERANYIDNASVRSQCAELSDTIDAMVFYLGIDAMIFFLVSLVLFAVCLRWLIVLVAAEFR